MSIAVLATPPPPPPPATRSTVATRALKSTLRVRPYPTTSKENHTGFGALLTPKPRLPPPFPTRSSPILPAEGRLRPQALLGIACFPMGSFNVFLCDLSASGLCSLAETLAATSELNSRICFFNVFYILDSETIGCLLVLLFSFVKKPLGVS